MNGHSSNAPGGGFKNNDSGEARPLTATSNPVSSPGDSTFASDSMTYSDAFTDQDSYSYVAGSSVTAGLTSYHDATRSIHEMHLALLYLLSNPEEFSNVPQATISDWNNDYSDEATTESQLQQQQTIPLPQVIFCDDAEVVLPQAHTASQLFGLERVEGIELEAAAGIPALSQLFQRWLALMPGGDHLNIIDPPGLTVMRISGGRYRVTAAHRVIWTWMNEFAPMSGGESNPPHVGDLVTMTIVDVFETDNHGKLLSYCPTFDNRAIHKTNQTAETLRRGSTMIMHSLQSAAKSPAATKMNQAAAHVTRLSLDAAQKMATSVQNKLRESTTSNAPQTSVDSQQFEHALNAAEQAATPQGQAYYLSEEEEDETTNVIQTTRAPIRREV